MMTCSGHNNYNEYAYEHENTLSRRDNENITYFVIFAKMSYNTLAVEIELLNNKYMCTV